MGRYKILLLVLLFLLLIFVDVEVSELIGTLSGCDNSQPVSQLLLLEELLCQVLQISLGERSLSIDREFRFVSSNGDCASQSSSLSIDLDTIMEVLFLEIEVNKKNTLYGGEEKGKRKRFMVIFKKQSSNIEGRPQKQIQT